MKLTNSLIRRAMQLRPGERTPRIVLDPRGIHHRTTPARDFTAAVISHAEKRKSSIAESLAIVERLRDLGAVNRFTNVRAQGAVFQAFHGSGDRQGCHTMPCQLILDHRFPHQLTQSDGQNFSTTYLARTIELFARCTWSPRIINPIDQALDWTPEADFVSMYLDSVKWVLSGEDSSDAYRELSWRRQRVLRDLCERVRDEPLNTYDAMILMGALDVVEPGKQQFSDPGQIDKLLSDAQFIETLQNQREIVVEGYASREQIVPNTVANGELKREIASELWTKNDRSSSAVV